MRLLFAPCQVGWITLTLALLFYGLFTKQWTVVLAVLAPLSGVLAAWWLSGRQATCHPTCPTVQKEKTASE